MNFKKATNCKTERISPLFFISWLASAVLRFHTVHEGSTKGL
jgi:hypothetical protein